MKNLRVIHRPAGYQGWLDTYTISQPNYRAIAMIAGGLFGAGVVVTLIIIMVLSARGGAQPPTPTEIKFIKTDDITVTATLNADATPTRIIIISTPYPTATPTITPSPTATVTGEPTLDLLATISAMQTQPPTTTPQPTVDFVGTIDALQQRRASAEPQPTATPEYPTAIINADAVIVRRGAGTDFRAVTTVYYGDQFPVLTVRYGWVQIQGSFGSGWVAGWLVRIED